jgi:hypothetical protein
MCDQAASTGYAINRLFTEEKSAPINRRLYSTPVSYAEFGA